MSEPENANERSNESNQRVLSPEQVQRDGTKSRETAGVVSGGGVKGSPQPRPGERGTKPGCVMQERVHEREVPNAARVFPERRRAKASRH